jgi:hypothetical protein
MGGGMAARGDRVTLYNSENGSQFTLCFPLVKENSKGFSVNRSIYTVKGLYYKSCEKRTNTFHNVYSEQKFETH